MSLLAKEYTRHMIRITSTAQMWKPLLWYTQRAATEGGADWTVELIAIVANSDPKIGIMNDNLKRLSQNPSLKYLR